MNHSTKIRKARSDGAQWEKIIFKIALSQGVLPIVMPLGARRIGPFKLVQIKTPFDLILIHNGLSVFVDAKSIDSDRIAFSHLTEHQVNTLSAIEEKGATAGYLIYFRPENAVCFARASILKSLKPGDALHGKDMVYLGGIQDFSLGRLFSLHLETHGH